MGREWNGERRFAGAKTIAAFALLVVPLWSAGNAYSQEGNDSGRQRGGSWAREHKIDPLTGKRLQKAREFLVEQQFDEADATLDKLRVRSLNPIEKTTLYTIRGYVALGREDLPAARDYFEQTIALGVLDADKRADHRFMIAQMYMQQENWAQVIIHLNKWFTLEDNPNANSYYFLALAHWQSEDTDSALESVSKAVALSDEPQESWLQLLLATRLTRKEYKESIPVLDELIRRYPKKIYWIQLSTVYGALGDYEESLIPLQLAYTQSLLTEDSEIRRLAELLLYLELPIRAAHVMNSGLDNQIVEEDSKYFELLSNSFILAREYDKAVAPLMHAADLADGGRIYQRLAEVHIQRERWEEAAEALGLALEKGNLPEPGQATLLMGIALYSQKKPGEALTWFGKAKKFSETKHEAEVWLQHIQREMPEDS
ncbi:MAG: tetratricopeptide repeat protein [Deltaproteobacteria bacterium]|nr:tetratricopeptide repeat protein [Deltaproteobacteria bacterium]